MGHVTWGLGSQAPLSLCPMVVTPLAPGAQFPSWTCSCGNGCRRHRELLWAVLLEVCHLLLGEGHLLHPQVHDLAGASQPIGEAAWGEQHVSHLSALEKTGAP